ncbi:hypothetical protein QR680_013298 [Steinernema hermaphroditum]|uniref:EF-hand domain-containing protein n=1 Tax=Steinernema hermaphroditum TaxID=289476 RepID=A0AA39I7C3_9BILA|nr:hypothetical protein QR680_013298 [Steinernema hermaphroditum]
MQQMEQEMCTSPGECNAWRDLFQSFDYDNDGYIPTNELKAAVRRSTQTFGLQIEEADILLKNMARAKKMRMRHVLFRAAQLVVPKSQRPSKFSYLLQYRFFPPPLVMITATIVQVAVYLYYILAESEKGTKKYNWSYVPVNSTLIYAPVSVRDSVSKNVEKIREWYELWRFVTYMFVHVGYGHLITNCIVQLFLGLPLELVHQWRIAIVYFLSGIFGCMLMAVTSPTTYVAGASGGVYGLLAAHVSDLFLNWSEMEFRWVRFGVLFVLIASDTSMQVWQSFTPTQVKVAYLAHLGGAIGGLLLGVLVLRNLRTKSWENVVWWVSLIIFVCSIAALGSLICFRYADLMPNFDL